MGMVAVPRHLLGGDGQYRRVPLCPGGIRGHTPIY